MFKKRKIAKSQIFINLGFETRVWLSDQSDPPKSLAFERLLSKFNNVLYKLI